VGEGRNKHRNKERNEGRNEEGQEERGMRKESKKWRLEKKKNEE
jgi:hypothetical protein